MHHSRRWFRTYERQGFTFVEVVIVMGIVGIMIATTSTALFRSQQQATLDSAVSTLVSDVRRQQLLSVTGHTQTAGTFIDYSVRFTPNAYILYPGSVYDPANTANFTVSVPSPVTVVSATVSAQTITFARSSGMIRNFAMQEATIGMQNMQTGSYQSIQFNPWGVPVLSQ